MNHSIGAESSAVLHLILLVFHGSTLFISSYDMSFYEVFLFVSKWNGCYLVPMMTICSLGLVVFRQHLQNLARTKGILELNKAQVVLGSGDGDTSFQPKNLELQQQVKKKKSSTVLLSSKWHQAFLATSRWLRISKMNHSLLAAL